MEPLETHYLFRSTRQNLEACTEILDNTEWGTLQWKNPDEEKASHDIYKLCKEYMAGYDFLHGDYPEE